MTCPKTEFWLADRLAGHPEDPEASQLEEHLQSCPDCRAAAERYDEMWDSLGEWPDEEPRPQVRERFEGMLAARSAVLSTSNASMASATQAPRSGWRQVLTWAAMVALALGGYTVGRGEREAPRVDAELQDLREEVATLTRMVSLNLLARDSASHRLRGVAFAQQAPNPDSELVDVLLDAVRHDDSINVRLAAIDTLMSFEMGDTPNEAIRGLLTPHQPPMVQIVLVDYLLATPTASDRDAVRHHRDQPGLDRDVVSHIDRLFTAPEGTTL